MEILEDLCCEEDFATCIEIANKFQFDDSEIALMSADTTVCIVQVLVELERIVEAVDIYQRALPIVKDLPAPWIVSAALRRAQKYELDVMCWRKWVEHVPGRPQPWIELARAYSKSGRDEDAVDILEGAANQFKQNASMYAQLGLSKLRVGDRSGALGAFRRALELDSMQPFWVRRGVTALAQEIVVLQGVKLAVPSSVVSAQVLRYLIEGGYEACESSILRKCLNSKDRILELGAGLGYLACVANLRYPGIEYCAVEANPDLIPVIKNTFRINNCRAKILHGAASLFDGSIPFHVADDFWASSVELITVEHSDISVPSIDIRRLIESMRPTVMVVDIEGGELELIPSLDLSTVERVIIELHPDVYDNSGSTIVVSSLLEKGFELDVNSTSGQVFLFVRPSRSVE